MTLLAFVVEMRRHQPLFNFGRGDGVNGALSKVVGEPAELASILVDGALTIVADRLPVGQKMLQDFGYGLIGNLVPMLYAKFDGLADGQPGASEKLLAIDKFVP